MPGPLLYLGLWDAEVSSLGLLDRVCTHLAGAGATIERAHEFGAVIRDFAPFVADGDTAGVHIIDPQGGPDGLLQVVTSIEDINGSPRPVWRPFLDQVLALVQAVNPALAVVAVEWPADDLPDPDWESATMLFNTGWVNLSKCRLEQRAAFEDILRLGLASRLGDGVWWSIWDDLNPENEPNVHPQPLFLARVYEAWTGRKPSPEQLDWPEPVTLSAEEMAPRQLWFWSASTSVEILEQRVALAAKTRGLATKVSDFGQLAPWPIVISQFVPLGRSIEALLKDLRAIVGQIALSWAGVQPKSGFVMPGPDAQNPFLSIVTHPWVSREWIGDELPRLEEALAGCHREELAAGILWITDPDLVPDGHFADDWYDAHERFERLIAAAEVLGQAARRSVGLEP